MKAFAAPCTACWLLAAFVAGAAGCGATGTADGPAAPPSDRVVMAAPAAQAPAAQAPTESPALADGRFPSDFAIDVTVLLGPGAPELLAVQDRQAKYILLPDGSLHADASPFVGMGTRPGRTRWLYEDQVQFLWSLCGQVGFLDAAAANGPPNPDMLRAGRDERMAVITLRAGRRTWTFVRRSTDNQPLDPAAARVVRALAVLAWIPDFRADDVVPERYDYGPDPYAAYREIRERQVPGFIR